MTREDWIEIELHQACGIHDNLRKPINSAERNKRIEGKNNSQLYPYYGATGQVGFIDDYLTDGEYVLIGEDGAPLFDSTKPIAYIIRGKTWVNNHAHILLSHFNNKFLLYFLNQFNFHGFVSGTTRLKLTQASLKHIPTPIAPLPEQRAIVSKIEQLFSELENGIANLKTAKAQLEVYRQAVLKKAFEGELTMDWRSKNKIPEASELLDIVIKENEAINKPKARNANKKAKHEINAGQTFEHIPNEWIFIEFDLVCDAIDPQPSHRTPPEVTNGIPYVGVGDIDKQKGVFDFNNARRVSINVLKEHIARYEIDEGDFVIGKIGTIGKPFFIPVERFYTLSANIVLVKPNKNVCSPKYLYLLTKSHIVENQFTKGSKATTQAAFGIQKVRTLIMPYCSLNEQHEVVSEIESRLSVCDKLVETIDESLEKSEALRQSILKKAFEGKLLNDAELEACRKEADWEPAEKLLARIEKDKTAGTEKTRGSKKSSRRGKKKRE